MTKVSLITASYNSARTIGDTLRSVNAQTYPRIEHLVIDGGSKDATMEIVGREGARVCGAVAEPDGGIYHAYNKGLARATGEIIGFINSDDVYCSDSVISQVMQVFEDPAVEGVHADVVYVDRRDTRRILRHWKSRPCTPSRLMRGFIPAHPTLFLRRSVYDKAGAFDTNYRLAADYEFMLRVFHIHRISAVYMPQIWVRMRAGGATGGNGMSILKQNEEIRAAQKAHGVNYPSVMFYAHKLIDRSLQRLRGSWLRMPAEATTR